MQANICITIAVSIPGLDFSYERFCNFVPILTRGSSEPTTVDNLNPLIHRVLTHYPGSTIFGVGGHSILVSISDDLAVKVSYRAGGEHIRHEQSIFKLLEGQACPYIVHSYFSAPDLIFMELVKNGRLYERMEQVDKPRPILTWMQQLSEAAVALEEVGYAHGDINPQNILFDEQDRLRLVDFDHALKVGEEVEVGVEPYVRHRYVNYGVAGPDTEQFALGSIFWFMTRGTEMYADIDGVQKVNRLSRCIFPEVDSADPIDVIISDCWQGKFESMAELAKRIRQVAFDKSAEEKKKACEQHYSSVLPWTSSPVYIFIEL
ncbi:hypothetical protein McanCB21832_002293 [Microsporum canis]